MADWYYAKDGERQGPVSSSQLRQMAQSGELLPTDMVFKEGGTQWIAASSINNLFAGPNAVSTRPDPGASGGMRRGGRQPDDDLGYDDQGYDDAPPIRRSGKGGNVFLDLLLFNRMVAPWLIMGLFYLGVVVGTCYALYNAGWFLYTFGVNGATLKLVFYILVAIPIFILAGRVYAEVLIVIFRIFDRLTDIKDLLNKDPGDKT